MEGLFLVAGCAALAAALVSSCGRSADGVAVTAGSASPTSTSVVAAPATTTTTTTSSTEPPASSVYGVVPTTRAAVPSCDQVSTATATTVAVVADPAAPRITLGVPAGWTVAPGSGDVGARLSGPDAMSATVSITPSPVDAATAFTRYSDRVMAAAPISSVSVLPAELCGYSGQKLMGNWSDAPGQSKEFADRIAHIWTTTKDYLVAIHVQAPTGSPGFDAATSVLMDDFGIGIP